VMVARGVASTVLLRPPRAVLSLLLLATVLLCSPLGVRGAGKSLNAVLKSSWSSTPLEGETAEFVAATTDEEGFWELVENMTTATWKALDTDRDRYQHLLSHVQHKHGTRASALLEVSMANREFSPKLEMYRQLAAAAWQDGAGHGEKMPCAFAVVNGNQIARKVEDVKQLLKSCTTLASNTLEPFDHIGPHRPSEPKGKPVVVLYAKLGSKSWRIWHRRLFELSEELLYVFRHSDCGCGEQTCGVGAGRFNLQGYGVELAIKNIEYKVKDDSALKGEQAKEGDAAAAAATADEEDEVDVEVEGFMFGKLIQKHPALKPELLQFKESLLSSQSFDEPLKVWEMADLSVQASLRVVTPRPDSQSQTQPRPPVHRTPRDPTPVPLLLPPPPPPLLLLLLVFTLLLLLLVTLLRAEAPTHHPDTHAPCCARR
jgi:UDP-glucose:glycoprotein glucosyltransferase